MGVINKRILQTGFVASCVAFSHVASANTIYRFTGLSKYGSSACSYAMELDNAGDGGAFLRSWGSGGIYEIDGYAGTSRVYDGPIQLKREKKTDLNSISTGGGEYSRSYSSYGSRSQTAEIPFVLENTEATLNIEWNFYDGWIHSYSDDVNKKAKGNMGSIFAVYSNHDVSGSAALYTHNRVIKRFKCTGMTLQKIEGPDLAGFKKLIAEEQAARLAGHGDHLQDSRGTGPNTLVLYDPVREENMRRLRAQERLGSIR